MKWHNTGLIARVFVTYLSVIAVLIIGITPLYYISANSIRDKEVSQARQKLNSGIARLEETVVDISWALSNLKTSYEYERLSSRKEPLSPTDLYYSTRVRNDFSMSLNGISVVSYAFLRFYNNDLIIDRERVYRNMQGFYGDYLSYPGIDAETFFSRPGSIWNSENVQDPLHSQPLAHVTIRMDAGSGNEFYMLIETNTLLNLLASSEVLEEGRVRIWNQEESLIVDSNPASSLSKRKSYEVHEEMEVFGLRVEVAFPRSMSSDGILETEGFLLSLITIVVLLCLTMAVAYTYRSTRPIQHIILGIRELVGEKARKEAPYDYISRSLAFIRNHQNHLTVMMQHYQERLRSNWIDSLLSGLLSSDDAVRQANDLGMQLPDSGRLLVFGLPSGYGEDNQDFSFDLDLFSALRAVREVLLANSFVERKATVHERYNKYIVLLIDDRPEEECIKIAQETVAMVRLHTHLPIHASISDVFRGVSQMAMEYNRAKNRLDFAYDQDLSVCLPLADETSMEADVSLSTLTQIYEFLLMGEQKRIQPILTAIFPPEMLSQGGFRQMFYSIRGQVVTAVNHLGATELGEVPDFDALQTNQELLTSLSTYMDSLCTFVNASRISHNNLLIENVLRYIQENYPNSSLNADLIADEFGISAKYVSQLVRSQTGKTYTEYVENMRLTQAMDLLENSETPVTQVAVAVGFLSQNTFYKSFRRVYNMSPTEYRAKQSH